MRSNLSSWYQWALGGALVFVSMSTMAFPEGPEPGYTGGEGLSDCSSCHFAGPKKNASSGIKLTGLAEQMVPGEWYEFTLEVTDLEQNVGGFQLAIRDLSTGHSVGELQPGAGQRVVQHNGAKFLSHSEPAEAQTEGGERVTRWAIQWRAARAQKVEFSAAVVAADGDDSALGDNVYTFSRIIQTD